MCIRDRHIAVDLGNLAIVGLLLDDPRVNVNAKSQQLQYTPLHLAADNGYVDCMRALLLKEAHVDVFSVRGQTPLQLCCKQAFIDCVQLLLEHGADVNTQVGLQGDQGKKTFFFFKKKTKTRFFLKKKNKKTFFFCLKRVFFSFKQIL